MAAVNFTIFGLNMYARVCVCGCDSISVCGRIVSLVWNNGRAKRYALSGFKAIQRLSKSFVLFLNV